MKQKKINAFLTFTAVFSFLLFLFSFFKVNKTENKAIKSALVNPSYSERIKTLIIQNPQELLTLRKQENYWTCEKSGIYTFADTKTIENFTAYLTKIRNMYKISDSKDAKIDLKLTEDSAVIITIIDENSKILSKLYFGNEDALTSRIPVTTEKGKICYETQDDFSPYLKTDLNFWAVPEIFFAIKNPSNLNLSASDLHTFQSLRHGKVFESTSLPVNAQFVKSITLYGQYDSSQRIDFYEYTARKKEGKNYLYTLTVEPQSFYNNAIFELSSWTYDKIKELLK